MADTYDLNLVQGERYQRGFRYKVEGVAQNLTSYTWRAEARVKEAYDATLIIDLTQYMNLNADEVTIDLDVPAGVTFALSKMGAAASWDLFMWPTVNPDDKTLLVQGAATLDLSTTDLT